MSKHKRPGQREDARADTKGISFDDVLALIKEQRKYLDWIRALEAKREQTSPQAYERVHADYQARLGAVAEKLASHRDTVAAEQTNLQQKLDEIDEEIQQHQDDRAETELRAHVGELTAAALTEALRVADTEIERLTAKRSAVMKDLTRIADFFSAAEGTTSGAAAPAKPRSQGGASFDELSFLNSVVGAEGQAKPSISQEMKAVAPATAESPPPLRPVEVPPAAPSPPVEIPPARPAEPAPGRPTPPPQPKPIEPPPAPTPPPTPTPPPAPSAVEAVQADGSVEKATELSDAPIKPTMRPSIAMQMSAMTIDADTQAPPVRDTLGIIKTGDELPPSILSDLKPSNEGEKPFAANVASNNPLSLKSTGSSDLKTLKCRECGAMNDPSEWYCERCGAELSAM